MKSIRSRLLIMLLVFIIVPYFISVLLIYSHTKKNVERHELNNSRYQLQKAGENLEQYLLDLTDLPYSLYRNPDLFRVFEKGFEESIFTNQLEIDKGMKTFYLMRNEIRQVRIYMAKGHDSFNVYNAMVSARKQQPEIENQAPIQNLLNSKSNFVIESPHVIANYTGSAIMPRSDRSMVLTIHHKIVDVLSKEFLGIVTIDVDLDQIARFSSHFIKEGQESVYLTDARGYVVYSSDSAWIGKPLSSDLKQKLYGAAEGLKEAASDDIVLSKALPGAFQEWQLAKVTSSGSLFREVRQTAYISIFVGIGMVILGLIMISIIAFKITRPIQLLSRKVRRIEGGNLNVPFDGTGDDEIGHLERHIKEMMNRINTHIEREYRLELENKTNQFRALKSQIHPHFLYNALQSIGAVALRSNSPDVYRLVTSFSNMMRYTIRTDQWATIRSEADYVKAYLSLQKERFREDFTYSMEIDETILDTRVPIMILQPLVENFFKHGLEAGEQGLQLSISGKRHGELIVLDVENDGPGLSGDELSRLRRSIYASGLEGTSTYEHIGLKNIQDRLMLNYGSAAGIEVESEGGQGFKVRLNVPMQPKEEFRHEDSARG